MATLLLESHKDYVWREDTRTGYMGRQKSRRQRLTEYPKSVSYTDPTRSIGRGVGWFKGLVQSVGLSWTRKTVRLVAQDDQGGRFWDFCFDLRIFRNSREVKVAVAGPVRDHSGPGLVRERNLVIIRILYYGRWR